jgi:outer membrane protein OmpA-like peptidoglycan-associated protein
MRASLGRACLAVAAITLAAAGCNDTGTGPNTAPSSSLPPMAPTSGSGLQSHYVSWPDQTFRVDLMGLDRLSSTRVVARFKVTSIGKSTAKPTAWAAADDGQDAAPTGTVLIDPGAGMEYRVLQTTTGGCLCSTSAGLAASQSVDIDTAFPAPATTNGRMIVVFPNTPPFLDVPISQHTPYMLAEPAGVKAVDPVTTPTTSPREYPLVNTVTHGKETDSTSKGKLSVRLSNDVVFGYNSAVLTPSSKSLLAQVAAKIDKSPSPTVTVDGYTDNTGNNAVNVPLSLKRAQSVVTELKKQVTRKDISYTSKGHGSADPIAPDSSAQGRALNRRVVISFTAPAATNPDATQVPDAKGDPAAQQAPTPIASVTAIPKMLVWPKTLKFSADGLIRDPDGYATLVWTFDNNSVLPEPAAWATNLSDIFRNSGPSRITLDAGQYEYKNLEDSQESAIFPAYSASLGDITVKSHGKLVGWNFFKLPAGVSKVTVNVPGFPALQNVPVDGLPS